MKINLLTSKKHPETASEIDWQEVYERLLPRVFHYFCYKTGDSFISEELTAITFEKAWAGRFGFTKKLGEFDAWVFGIARRTAVDHFRKRSTDAPLTESLSTDGGNQLEDNVEKKMMFLRICQLIDHFTDREKELISLKYGGELNNREIARMTGLTESNVGTILNRCVIRLREQLKEEV
jgi:RNA polymerase sigma-70 factor, ECF subfamily